MLTAKEVKEKYGYSRSALIEYEEQGLLHPQKTPNGHRRYDEKEIDSLMVKPKMPFLFKIYRQNQAKLPNVIRLFATNGGKESMATYVGESIDDLDIQSQPDVYTYEKRYLRSDGVRTFIDDPKLMIVLKNQIPINLVFEPLGETFILSSNCTSFTEKLYKLEAYKMKGYINLSEIVRDINEKYRIHYYKTLRYFPEQELNQVDDEYPSFFLGEELQKTDTGFEIITIYYELVG